MTQPEYDDLWPGGPRFVRSGAGFALGTDSVLLADFAAQRRARRIADLGCGAGVLTVLLLRALEQATAVGIELQPDAAQLARDTTSEQTVRSDRAQILCADLRTARCSPPGASTSSLQTHRISPPEAAHHLCRPDAGERAATALHHAGHLHRHGLSYALGRRGRARAPAGAAQRAAVRAHGRGLEPKRLRTVAYKADAA